MKDTEYQWKGYGVIIPIEIKNIPNYKYILKRQEEENKRMIEALEKPVFKDLRK